MKTPKHSKPTTLLDDGFGNLITQSEAAAIIAPPPTYIHRIAIESEGTLRMREVKSATPNDWLSVIPFVKESLKAERVLGIVE